MKYALLGLYIASYCSGFASMAMSFVVWRNPREKGFILFFVSMIAFLLRLLALNLVFFLRSFMGIEAAQDGFLYYACEMVITAFFNAAIIFGAHGIVERSYGRLRQPALLTVALVPLGLLMAEVVRRLSGLDSAAARESQLLVGIYSTDALVIYCVAFFLLNLKKAGNLCYTAIMKAHIVMSFVMLPLYALQVQVNDNLGSEIRPLSVADNVYFFILNLVAIIVLARHYLLRPVKEPDWIAANYAIKKNADLELTEREWEIVALLGEGLANKEIAARLSISPATVKNHLYNVYQKTGVKSRVELLNTVK
jgi:DNA-binding CsgD family transcriptional regulator